MKFWLTIFTCLCTSTVLAGNFTPYEIPMQSHGTRTYYVQTDIHGSGKSMLLIDTGSGHTVINEETLTELKYNGKAKFIKNLRGLMADGTTRIVPLYRISAITIGKECVINDVEAAVLPDNTRQILGISALQKAAPFSLSFNPPMLSLGKCGSIDESVSERAIESKEAPAAATPVETELNTPDQLQAMATTGKSSLITE